MHGCCWREENRNKFCFVLHVSHLELSLIIFVPPRFLGTKVRAQFFFTIVFKTWDFDVVNLVFWFLQPMEFGLQIVIGIADQILCYGFRERWRHGWCSGSIFVLILTLIIRFDPNLSTVISKCKDLTASCGCLFLCAYLTASCPQWLSSLFSILCFRNWFMWAVICVFIWYLFCSVAVVVYF